MSFLESLNNKRLSVALLQGRIESGATVVHEKMTSTGDVETRAVIKFCVGLCKTPTETMNIISESDVKPKCSRALVFKWHWRFKN